MAEGGRLGRIGTGSFAGGEEEKSEVPVSALERTFTTRQGKQQINKMR